MQEKLRYKWVLIVTKAFNIAVSDFDAKKSARCRRDPVNIFFLHLSIFDTQNLI